MPISQPISLLTQDSNSLAPTAISSSDLTIPADVAAFGASKTRCLPANILAYAPFPSLAMLSSRPSSLRSLDVAASFLQISISTLMWSKHRQHFASNASG
jgi:hypothetical protein